MTFLAVAPAWADHGGELRGTPLAPWLVALLWGVGAFALGLAVMAIANAMRRRRSPVE